ACFLWRILLHRLMAASGISRWRRIGVSFRRYCGSRAPDGLGRRTFCGESALKYYIQIVLGSCERDRWRGAMAKLAQPLAFLLIAAAIGTGSTAFAEDTLKLTVGQRGLWDTSISDVGQRAGIFKKHGLTLEILYTQGSGETQQAVFSGSVDVG